MGWNRVDIVFELKSPLHIGYLPSKDLFIAPTRYYVAGRNLWGAITKRATENLFHAPRAEYYQEMGKKIKRNFRFTCFFIYDGNTIYFPKYTQDGLKYGDRNCINVLEFERRFVDSIILTAIERKTGSAKDESLHEIEFLKNKYRDRKNNVKNTKIIGCVWVKDEFSLPSENGKKKVNIQDVGIFADDFNLISELTLGGEQNYGFGLVELESIGIGKFTVNDVSDNEGVRIEVEENSHIFFHLEYDKHIPFEGDIELFSGRRYPQDSSGECFRNPGRHTVRPWYFFSPGTLIKTGLKCMLMEDGTARIEKN